MSKVVNAANRQRVINSKKQGGFTLKEMVVTIGLLGTISAVSAPYFSEIENNTSDEVLQKAATQMVEVFNKAYVVPANTATITLAECQDAATLAGINSNSLEITSQTGDCGLSDGTYGSGANDALVGFETIGSITVATVK